MVSPPNNVLSEPFYLLLLPVIIICIQYMNDKVINICSLRLSHSKILLRLLKIKVFRGPKNFIGTSDILSFWICKIRGVSTQRIHMEILISKLDPWTPKTWWLQFFTTFWSGYRLVKIEKVMALCFLKLLQSKKTAFKL